MVMLSSTMTPKSTSSDVGQRLATVRLQKGLAQNDVALRAGIAPSYLSRIENGKVHPTIGTAQQVASALGTDLAEVLKPRSTSRGPCPVTKKGQCLLDLIRPKSSAGHFTPREVRLIQSFASWVEQADATRLRAMEILLDDLSAEHRHR